MRIGKWLQIGLLGAGLAVQTGFAQSQTTSGSAPGVETPGATTSPPGATDATGGKASASDTTRNYSDGGNHNFGWVGLIGLAGLAGLMRGNSRRETDAVSRNIGR